VSVWIIVAATGLAALMSLFFSALTYSLRDFSRARLTDLLEKSGRERYLQPTVDHANELILVTAVGRAFSNILIVIGVLRLLQITGFSLSMQFLLSVVLGGAIQLICSVGIPHAIGRHAGEETISTFVSFLHGMRLVMLPFTKLFRATEFIVAKAATSASTDAEQEEKLEQEVEQEILSAVEEGEKEGVVDEDERRMIERVIAFHDTQVVQIMTPRPEIFAIELHNDLDRVKEVIAESGHSRIPVYDGTLDHIAGILYARDLIKLVGEPPEKFNLRASLRPPLFVPETKLLRDLLRDFTLHKVHIAIVSDEYGGTSGLITIEDIFEELVGEISDEHEPEVPAMLKRIDDQTVEADGRVPIDELNRVLGLNLPEEAGYETLAGFVSTTVGRIPEPGASFEYEGTRYVVVDAEPQRVNRVRIEMAPQPAEKGS